VSPNVKPIPDQYHTVTPHMVVKDCAKAIEFYKKAFNAEVRGIMDGPGGKVMHAEIKIGNSIIMLNDEFADMGAVSAATVGGNPTTLHIYVEDADKLYNQAVGAGATVKMPIADMFWGDRYGVLKDPFGNSWSVATHKEDLTPAQMDERMKSSMKG